MKVGIVSDHLPGYHRIWSGAELIAVTLAQQIAQAGCRPFFLASSFDCNQGRKLGPVFEIPTPLYKYKAVSANFPVDLRALWGLYRVLRQERPDIVHINGQFLYLPALIVCRWLGIPAVYTVADYFIFCPRTFIRLPDGRDCTGYHGPACRECVIAMKQGPAQRIVTAAPKFLLNCLFMLRQQLFDYVNHRVGCFIALSGTSRQRLIDYGITPDRVRVIYHYQLDQVMAPAEPVAHPAAVFVGWLSVENGTDVLVDAFLQVIGKVASAKLYLIGTGKDEFVIELKKKINAAGAGNSIIFLGKRANREALGFIERCDVTVVPHQWAKEFGPVVLLEAAAMGKPVITSGIGATHEYVDDGNSGYLIKDYRNPEAFAARIAELLTDGDLCQRMGEAGREKARFLVNGTPGRQLVELYTDIIRHSNKRA